MSTNIWDDPEVIDTGDYVSFMTVGDTVTGTITAIRKHTFDDGKIVPQISLTCPDGRDRIVTAGQIRLKAALAEHRPGVGDTITITLADIEKRAGGKTLKHFDVVVGPQTGTPAPAPTPAAPAAAPAAPAASAEGVAALLGSGVLTAEQQAALKALGL